MWNVLIADDEPKIRQGLKNTLETFDLPLCCLLYTSDAADE